MRLLTTIYDDEFDSDRDLLTGTLHTDPLMPPPNCLLVVSSHCIILSRTESRSQEAETDSGQRRKTRLELYAKSPLD